MVQVFAFHLMPYGKMPEDFNITYLHGFRPQLDR